MERKVVLYVFVLFLFSFSRANAQVGIGTTSPITELQIFSPNQSATLTNFTQGLSNGGFLIQTSYTDGTYTPGLFWSTSNQSATKPKAGIFLRQTGANGTFIHFGTSSNYATGITSSDVVIDPTGNLGVGITSTSAKLDVGNDVGGGYALILGGDVTGSGRTNSTRKFTRIGSPHFTNTEEPVHFGSIDSDGSDNIITLGGGTSIGNAATTLRFYTAANSTTLTGSERMRITSTGNVGIGTTTPANELEVAGWVGRSQHNNGGLVGSYNNIAANDLFTNPIYIIGSNYKPTTTVLNNMYGVGYTHTNASFVTAGSGPGWGQYIASDGDARIWLGAGTASNSYFNTTGNLGLGTNTPAAKLHIQGSVVGDQLRIQNSVAGTPSNFLSFYDTGGRTGYFGFAASGDDHLYLRSETATGDLIVFTNSTERMRVLAGGNVGVGTTSPTEKLHVVGSLRFSSNGESAGDVLVSDATGVATWQPASAVQDGNGIYDGDGTTPAGVDVTVTDQIDFDGGTVFIDGTNNRLGVGTTTPDTKIAIAPTSNGDEGLRVTGVGASGGVVGQAIIGLHQWEDAATVRNFSSVWLEAEEAGPGDFDANFHVSTRNSNSDVAPTRRLTILDNGNVGVGTQTPANELEINGWIGRSFHNIGGLVGSYDNIAPNPTFTNPIYIIGSNYKPNNSSLNNMYGVGYTHTNASFITASGGAGWGQYVAADGDARIWLGASVAGGSYFNTSGNFGIGTDSPTEKLHISRSTNGDNEIRVQNANAGTAARSVVRVETNSSSGAMIYHSTAHSTLPRVMRLINNDAAGDIRFYFNGADNMTLEEDGQVGIGTTSPTEKLHVVGSLRFSGNGESAGDVLISDATGVATWQPASTVQDGNGIYDGDGTTPSNVDVTVTDNIDFDGGTLFIDGANNEIGLGTTTPGAKLEVRGTTNQVQMIVKANATQTITNPLIQLQNSAGTPIMEINSNTSSNAFIGVDAGDAITSGIQNTAIGSSAASLLSTGTNNTALGFQAGNNLTSGNNNIIIGSGNTATSSTGSNQLDIGDVIYGDLSTGRVAIGTTAAIYQFNSVTGTSNSAAIYGQNGANGGTFGYGVFGRHTGNGASLVGHAFYGLATGGTNTNYGIYNTVSGGTSFNYGTRADVSGGAFSYGFFGTINSGTTSNRGVYLTASGASTLGNIGVYASADGSTTNTNHGIWGSASGGGTNNYGLYGQASGATNNYGLYVASGETVISDAGTTVPTRSITGSIGLAAVGGSGRIYYRANGGFYFVNHSGFGDYSEYFRRSDQTLEVGDIVAIDFNDHNAVRKADAAHGDGQRIMGIVSKYGTRNNDDTDGLRHSDSSYVNIGLLGQVQLKVSTENGVIQPGDALTLSPNQPGVAVKATKSCRIIGFSMTHYPYVEEEETYPTHTGTNKEDDNLDVPHVMVYVQAGYWESGIMDDTVSKVEFDKVSELVKVLQEQVKLLKNTSEAKQELYTKSK